MSIESFKGTKPADLPIERPTKSEPVADLTTGRTLGFTVLQSLLLGADPSKMTIRSVSRA